MAIRTVALAGMVSDTSLYNIDGACVYGGTPSIAIGHVVGVTEAQPVDGHKVIGTPTADALPYGVLVRSHYEAADGTYKNQEACNVLTHGRIWVRAGAGVTADAVVFGAPVFVGTGGTVVISAPGVFNTGWKFAGGYLPAADNRDGVNLVEVQVLQSSTATVVA